MNKILEAILKGIQMGLEIQDDGLDLPIFLKSGVTSNYHTDRAALIRFVRGNFVDLGLPSGTLWCKWNLGATNGDTAESWYGNYYAWGETTPKTTYNRTNYKYGKMWLKFSKYNDEDGKTMLDSEDDAVNAALGYGFKMPTYEQISELCECTTNTWETDYNGIKGLNGRVFTGKNGNIIFIPAAGCYAPGVGSVGELGYIWAKNLNLDETSYLFLDDTFCNSTYAEARLDGISVRAVLNKNEIAD